MIAVFCKYWSSGRMITKELEKRNVRHFIVRSTQDIVGRTVTGAFLCNDGWETQPYKAAAYHVLKRLMPSVHITNAVYEREMQKNR